MDSSQMTQSQDNSRWVDFDTLVAESVMALRAKDWGRHKTASQFEVRVRRDLLGNYGTPSKVLRMIGGQTEFQDKSPVVNPGLHARFRVRLRGGEQVVFEDVQEFVTWMHENFPTLKAWVEREKLGAAAPEPKAEASRPRSRAL
jgi:hypothetical protein